MDSEETIGGGSKQTWFQCVDPRYRINSICNDVSHDQDEDGHLKSSLTDKYNNRKDSNSDEKLLYTPST